MALAGFIIGLIGVGVTITSGIVHYRGRMKLDGDGLYTVPEGHGLSLTLVIVGAALTIAGLVVGLIGAMAG